VLIFKGEKTLRHSKKEGKKVLTYRVVGYWATKRERLENREHL